MSYAHEDETWVRVLAPPAMIVAADASVLVAELLRQRGRALLACPDLRVVLPKEQWDETEYELQRRVGIIVEQGRLTADQARSLSKAVRAVIEDGGIEVVPRAVYQHMEVVARRRVPRDPHDWLWWH